MYLSLSWAVIVAPVLFAIVIELAPEKFRKSTLWRIGVLAFGILLSVLVWLQQYQTVTNARADQQQAVEETASKTASKIAATLGQGFAEFKAILHEELAREGAAGKIDSKRIDIAIDTAAQRYTARIAAAVAGQSTKTVTHAQGTPVPNPYTALDTEDLRAAFDEFTARLGPQAYVFMNTEQLIDRVPHDMTSKAEWDKGAPDRAKQHEQLQAQMTSYCSGIRDQASLLIQAATARGASASGPNSSCLLSGQASEAMDLMAAESYMRNLRATL